METFYDLIGRENDPITWWQMSVRACIIFAWAVILYRVLPRRAFGSSATLDIVAVVILGSTLSRALTGNAPLLPALAATAIFATLYTVLASLAWRFEPLSRLVKGRAIRVIRDGKIDRRAMRKARLGEHDLIENLRLKGLTDPDQVAEGALERNGEFSVIRKG
jgi:uncharacterized membrane protein YcaP (DUF421 family)